VNSTIWLVITLCVRSASSISPLCGPGVRPTTMLGRGFVFDGDQRGRAANVPGALGGGSGGEQSEGGHDSQVLESGVHDGPLKGLR
jgi:hypothetical protein